MQPVRTWCDEYFSTKSKLYNQRKILMDQTREGALSLSNEVGSR